MNSMVYKNKGKITTLESKNKLFPSYILFSSKMWKSNRIDNEFKGWINFLSFHLETPQLVILLRGWNETKEEILEKLNTLSQEQKNY